MPRTTQVNNLAFHRAVDEAPRTGIGGNVPEFRALAAIYNALNAASGGGGVSLTANQAQRRFYYERQSKCQFPKWSAYHVELIWPAGNFSFELIWETGRFTYGR